MFSGDSNTGRVPILNRQNVFSYQITGFRMASENSGDLNNEHFNKGNI